MQTPAFRAFREQRPDERLWYVRPPQSATAAVISNNPHLDRQLDFDPAVAGCSLEKLEWWPQGCGIHMDAWKAFEYATANRATLVEGFGNLLGVQVTDHRYVYTPTEAELVRGREWAEAIGAGRPIVICARHSHSCASHDPNIRRPNKCWSNEIWCRVAAWLTREGFTPVAIGSLKETEEERFYAWPGPKLYGRPLRDVAGLLKAAAGVISVDTGIRHLAAAVGANSYCCSTAIPLSMIHCTPVQEGQKIYEEERPLPYVTWKSLTEGVQRVL